MTSLSGTSSTIKSNGRAKPDPSEWDCLSRRQLKRWMKDRGLGSGEDFWRASKPILHALLRGEIDTLPAWDLDRPKRAALAKIPANKSEIEPIVRELVEAELKRHPPQPTTKAIEISFPDKPNVKIEGMTHERFGDVLRLVSAGIPVLLVGPAGSGKTKLASQIAAALDRPFTFNSMSAGVTESSLLGRVLPDADGAWNYKPAPFVRTYRDGGVHLFDEIDAADPNLMVVINAAIANGQLAIPFADIPPIERHPDTVLIAAANTYGNGADRMYVGRNQLDAATVDRFTMGTISIGYDRQLEAAIVKTILPKAGGKLLDWAEGIRNRIAKSKLRRIMSTRSIEGAARRIATGASLDDIKATYYSGWSADERAKVEG